MPFILRKTITETFLERVRATPNAVGFQYKPTHPGMGEVNSWKEVTFQSFYDECRIVSYGLMDLGIRSKDKVVILSNTRYEWSLCDMATLGAGAITVPIYASNTASDVLYILNHCEARVAFLEDGKQLEKVLEKRAEKPGCLPKLEKIVVFEPSGMNLLKKNANLLKDVLTLQSLKELGRRGESKDPKKFDRNLASADPRDLITICYTSGTTGLPKGAMITHDNMMCVLEDCVAVIGKFVRPEKEVVLSFLPFSHILAKIESMAVYTFGWKDAFAENLDKLMTNIGEIRPTLLFAVPRIFEKAFSKIHSNVDAGPAIKKKLFKWSFQVGRTYYDALWSKKNPSIGVAARYAVAKGLVFKKVYERFGGRLRFALCGGAPLPKEIGEFFQIAGIKILEGYGLTETCAPSSINTPDDPRFGTVGRPMPEVTVKIASDGEILIKSRRVFEGYYKIPEETAQALQDGWFHTGDIGHLDKDGFLHITDRKKDLIITSAGKNIAPQKIENLAKSQGLISQFVVHGDRRNYLTALLTLDREQAIRYASENQILFSEYAELVKNPKILARVQKIIDEVNRQLASFETIKKFYVVPDEFTIEGGELTPSMKIRRGYVSKRYKTELDSMYSPELAAH